MSSKKKQLSYDDIANKSIPIYDTEAEKQKIAANLKRRAKEIERTANLKNRQSEAVLFFSLYYAHIEVYSLYFVPTVVFFIVIALSRFI